MTFLNGDINEGIIASHIQKWEFKHVDRKFLKEEEEEVEEEEEEEKGGRETKPKLKI